MSLCFLTLICAHVPQLSPLSEYIQFGVRSRRPRRSLYLVCRATRSIHFGHFPLLLGPMPCQHRELSDGAAYYIGFSVKTFTTLHS